MKVEPQAARDTGLYDHLGEDYRARFLLPDWQEKRALAIEIAGGMCAGCGRDDVPLQVHHLSYRRFGHEQWYDLLAVCAECHPYADRLRKQRKALGEQNVQQVKRWARIMGKWGAGWCPAGEWNRLRWEWTVVHLPAYIQKEREREAQDALAVSPGGHSTQAVCL